MPKIRPRMSKRSEGTQTGSTYSRGGLLAELRPERDGLWTLLHRLRGLYHLPARQASSGVSGNDAEHGNEREPKVQPDNAQRSSLEPPQPNGRQRLQCRATRCGRRRPSKPGEILADGRNLLRAGAAGRKRVVHDLRGGEIGGICVGVDGLEGRRGPSDRVWRAVSRAAAPPRVRVDARDDIRDGRLNAEYFCPVMFFQGLTVAPCCIRLPL
mmetsp:Transcript_18688/g.49581  ORF Transcript_18688/g.49581 Transcript_18688/m.49581 type:complete len:212 (-) Transcript_18688:7-642(-)